MALRPPLEPMLARAREIIPGRDVLAPGAAAEMKYDGYRAILFTPAGPRMARILAWELPVHYVAFDVLKADGRFTPPPPVCRAPYRWPARIDRAPEGGPNCVGARPPKPWSAE